MLKALEMLVWLVQQDTGQCEAETVQSFICFGRKAKGVFLAQVLLLPKRNWLRSTLLLKLVEFFTAQMY